MSNSSIQDQQLQVTVVKCTNLTRTQLLGKQDPYVCLEYGGQNCRTRVCTDGDKNPKFNEKFPFKLIEGIREINVNVWNKNMLEDNFIAGGKIQLSRVIKEGYDDSSWILLNKSGRSAGEVKVILHYENVEKNSNKPEEKPTPSAFPAVYLPPPPPVYLPPLPVYPPPPVYLPPPPPVHSPPSPPYVYPSTLSSDGDHHQGYQQESSSEWCSSSYKGNSHQPQQGCPPLPQRPGNYFKEHSEPSAPPEPSQRYHYPKEHSEPSAPTEPSQRYHYPRHYFY